MRNKNIWLAFAIAFAMLLIFPLIWPGFHLVFFAPCLVIAYYQKSLIVSLRLSLISGLLLDLLSSHEHLGLYAISYCLATCILYRVRYNFFADNLSTLPLMTFFFSIVATVFQMMLLLLFEREFTVSFAWVLTDLIVMPLCDAVYGFIFFVCPGMLLKVKFLPKSNN